MSLIETDFRPARPDRLGPDRLGQDPPGQAADHDLLELPLRRLDSLSPLGAAARELVRSGVGAPSAHRAGADLGDDGDGSCWLLASGWACRVSETPWGGRQILDFVLPGDAIGLTVRPKLEGLYRVVALGRSVTLDAKPLRRRLRTDSAAGEGLRRACDEAERAMAHRLVDHTGRLGGVSATQAMAHLLLELRARLAQVGLLSGPRFPMPLSQDNLHDALGITSTQVYRILSQMRKEGLIALGPGWAEIADPDALATAAGLKPWRE